jgi:hypothetical protein
LRFIKRDQSQVRAVVSPVAPTLLLVLFAHAFLASVTHFHRFERWNGALSDLRPCVVSQDAAERTPDASGHTQCLHCGLQRNFISDLYQAAPHIAPPPQPESTYESIPAISSSDRGFLAPTGRAPPLA